MKKILYLLFATVFLCFQSCNSDMHLLSENPVEIMCTYAMNACGECSPQFEVEKVISQNGVEKILLSKTINASFKDPKDAEFIKDNTCLICYSFKMKGLIYEKNNEYVIYVNELKKDLRDKCCDI